MILLKLLGWLFLVLGAIGIILPVWPTTGFWIIAALCFARSSPRTRDWIYSRPGVGPVVQEFVDHGRLTRSAKIGALIGMSIAAGICAYTLWGRPVFLYLALGLIGIGMTVVITRPEP
ncbi:MAG: YbaN family protein [Pseudomonadota bacterium]